jgi:hypothetical protein
MNTGDPLSCLLVLVDAVASRIATQLGAAVPREEYSSANPPPRITRRRFAEVCRSDRVIDAHKDGDDWVCSRAAWEAARVRKPVPRHSGPRPPADLESKADAALARAGLRVVRGPR